MKVNKDRKLLSHLTITSLKRLLPQNHTVQHVYISRKLGSAFDIKDQTKLVHKRDLTYLVKCPEDTCFETYLGETSRRLNERIMELAQAYASI